ncbi:hypothetical protein [Streptomyces sp. NPDC059816]|uniref:hypothetical protein n=1 Tax=Streptomyces sp. NPDC059816 TaxID=3346960 RepID=UPI00364CACDE
MDSNVEAYLTAIRQAPFRLIERYLTPVCTECDEHVVPSDAGDHVMVGSSVAVGCLGYYLVDPNVLGIKMPTWSDWTTADRAESHPTTLYSRGAALVQFAESLGLMREPRCMSSLGPFYDEQLIGHAIAAMSAWLEAERGPVTVRAALKESMYYTDDESQIGAVPRFTYGGNTLSVGDTVDVQKIGPMGENADTFRAVIKEISPTYWGSELCPTGVVLDGPDVPVGESWDWHSMTKVDKP